MIFMDTIGHRWSIYVLIFGCSRSCMKFGRRQDYCGALWCSDATFDLCMQGFDGSSKGIPLQAVLCVERH